MSGKVLEPVIEGGQKAPEAPEATLDAKALMEKIQDLETRSKAEIAGLNRRNTELQKALEDKEKAGMSIEERFAQLEKENQEAKLRVATVEAFATAGVADEWRQALTLHDPKDQATMIKGLIEGIKSESVKSVAGEFARDPSKLGSEGLTPVSVEDLKGKNPAEINALWAKGLVKTQAS